MTATGETAQPTVRRRAARGLLPSLRQALEVVWLPWLLARVLVGAALGLSRYELSHLGITSTKAITVSHQGLLSWDASWYTQIAAGGYHSVPREGLRFFPLYPEVLGALHGLTRAPLGTLALVVANLASLAAVMGLYLLCRRELDATAARRAAWLLCLSPASFVLAMGYAEGLFLLLTIAAFATLRTKLWWLAAAIGLLAGLTRPIGLLLVVPALVEVWRTWSSASSRAHVAQVAAIAAPVVGAGAYLAWVAHAFGDFFLPLRIQTAAGAHGGLSNPFSVLWSAARDLFHGHVGTALHVPWIALCVVLVVVCFQRLPLSYALFATAVVLAAVSGHNLDSFERYALSAVPLVMAGGSLLRSERVALPVLIASSVAMFAYALLAFLGAYVP